MIPICGKESNKETILIEYDIETTVDEIYERAKPVIKEMQAEQELDEEIKYLWNKILKKCEKYR